MPQALHEADKVGRPRVTARDIARGLRRIGLHRRDLVVVHSSLSAFGYVEGGAEAVIDALLEAVGPRGTVVMPTFHDGALYRAPKDPKTTPSDLGLVSNTFAHRPGVTRGLDCNLAAVGPLALEIVNYAPLPPGRPRSNAFYRIAELGGRILLLGVGQDRNSTLHPAQALAIEHTDGIAIDIYEAGGGYEFLRLEDGSLDAGLLESGKMRVGMIGAAQVRLIDGLGFYQVIRQIYQQSEKFRAHTREHLERVAQSRRQALSRVRELTEYDGQCLTQADRIRAAVRLLRYAVMQVAEEVGPADRAALSQWVEDGDLRLFADQLEGRLVTDFAATMALLQNAEFAAWIERRLRPTRAKTQSPSQD